MSTTTMKSQLSLWRITIAVFTCGVSLPFFGIRKPMGRSKIIRTHS